METPSTLTGPWNELGLAHGTVLQISQVTLLLPSVHSLQPYYFIDIFYSWSVILLYPIITTLFPPLTIGVGFSYDCYNPFLGDGLVNQNKFHRPDYFVSFLILLLVSRQYSRFLWINDFLNKCSLKIDYSMSSPFLFHNFPAHDHSWMHCEHLSCASTRMM